MDESPMCSMCLCGSKKILFVFLHVKNQPHRHIGIIEKSTCMAFSMVQAFLWTSPLCVLCAYVVQTKFLFLSLHEKNRPHSHIGIIEEFPCRCFLMVRKAFLWTSPLCVLCAYVVQKNLSPSFYLTKANLIGTERLQKSLRAGNSFR